MGRAGIGIDPLPDAVAAHLDGEQSGHHLKREGLTGIAVVVLRWSYGGATGNDGELPLRPQLLSGVSGVAIQLPDAIEGLRRPSPCSVIAGP